MTTILKPGILVSLKTTLHGGVSYERRDLDVATPENGEHRARWETTRTIEDPVEYAAAVKLRGQVAGLVRGRCAQSAFGMLCPESREAELDAAVAEGRRLCDEWNRQARTVQVHAYCLKGRIASTDEEAARAIASEVEGLLVDMERGIRGGDPKAIREAADRARAVGQVLDEERGARVAAAVEAARKAAREITRRVEKKGEDAAEVVRELAPQREVVSMARFAFLDAGGEEQRAEEKRAELPGVELQRFAEIDS